MMKAALKEEQFLIFRVGLVACCVPIESIDSVVRAQSQELHHFPNQASYISGVIQHRGKAISIVNLFQKFAQTPPRDEPGDYILSHTKFGLVGFWVNEVLEIINTNDEDWGASPKFLGENIFHQTLLWHDKLILKTEFDCLIAMNDSERLHEWAIQNNSDLFTQPAANSTFEELEDSQNIDHNESVIPDQSDIVFQHSQPVVVSTANELPSISTEINNDIEVVETEPDTNFESALPTIGQESEVQTPLSSVELAVLNIEETDIISSAIEDKSSFAETMPVNEAVVGNETAVANEKVVNSQPINNSSKIDSKLDIAEETTAAPGSAQFMAGSDVVNDVVSDIGVTVPNTSMIGEQLTKTKPLISANNDITPSKSVSENSHSTTEKISQQINHDEDSFHESAFAEVEKLVTDDEKSSAEVIEQTSDSDIETTIPSEQQNLPDIKTTDKHVIVDVEKNEIKEGSNEEPSSMSEFKTNDSIDNAINDYIAKTESGFQDTNNNDSITEDFDAEIEAQMAEKREASIHKVINRIEKNNPKDSAVNRFRLIASVIVAASAVFFVQHYYMNGDGTLSSDSRTIELLADNKLESVPNSQSILNTVESNVTSSTDNDSSEENPILLINSIPKSQSVRQSTMPEPIFPWRKHVVNKGDTLWDLSEYYLKNPFRYPELARWSNIKNPDLIYPGDEVKYQDDQGVEVQSYRKQ